MLIRFVPVVMIAVLIGGQPPAAGQQSDPTEPAAAGGAKRKQLSQHGITWTFDRPATAGQFVTGDWWVVGPVTVASISPAPGPADPDASVNIKRGVWGDTSLRNDKRMRNGSMVVLKAGGKQGYDSRSTTYDPELSVKLPYTLAVNRSLISTISHTSLPADNFCHKIMWRSEKKSQCALKAAAVLTCLAQVPSADAFRPAYAGTDKPIYRAKDLKWDLLGRLKPAGRVPSWEDFDRYFQRPWLEHMCNWAQQELNPTENQPNYGREHARLVSMASLMLQLDVPKERKEKLLIGLVQYGIDVSGVAKVGGQWNWGGGHSSGRKWPVLFASLMLDKPELRRLPETAVFHEDAQTYYGKGWFGQTVLWQMVIHHGPRESYEEKPPEKWEQWDKTSEGYRCCCNAVAWVGTALSARHMKAIKVWEHDAFFDYCDRWMRTDDPYAAARGKHARPKGETKTFDPFVDAMWRAYRKTAPKQEMSGKNRKWIPSRPGKWVPNPRPKD
ncbi:MAG TPA: hypothetical protein VNA25_12445 [Phycisphaerae bacterium]|nr:hypothetical protein [Phycisphaerae bacterium]